MPAASDTLERLTGTVEVLKASGEAEGGRFRIVANSGGEFARAYGRAVADLSAMKVPTPLPILLNHDENQVVGMADTHTLTAEGLVLEGDLLLEEEAGRRVGRLSGKKFPLKASVGADSVVRRLVEAGQKVRLNGKEFTGPIWVWESSSLFETSVVTSNPADKKTSTQVLTEERPMTPDEFLKAHPEAVKAWKDEAAKAQALADKTRLADLLKALPAGRERFVLEQYAAGADLLTAKAALADVLMAEATEKAKAPKDEAPKDPLLEALKAKSDHPGLGFNGNARQDGSPEERMRAEAASAGVDPEALAAFERATKKGYVRVGVVDRAAAAIGRGE